MGLLPGRTFSSPPRSHMRWCMRCRFLAVSFEIGGGKNVPGIPGACATHTYAYLVRGPWNSDDWLPAAHFSQENLLGQCRLSVCLPVDQAASSICIMNLIPIVWPRKLLHRERDLLSYSIFRLSITHMSYKGVIKCSTGHTVFCTLFIFDDWSHHETKACRFWQS